MRTWRISLCLFFVTAMMHTLASPLTDLASPSPQIRTHAAQIIRANHLYKASPRAPWDEMTSTFKRGDTSEAIVSRLQERGLMPGAQTDLFDRPGVLHIPLDDSWVLLCTIHDSQLIEYKLVEEPKEIRVFPPASYSGFWRTYRINGELAGLYDYQNGRNLGNTLHMQ